MSDAVLVKREDQKGIITIKRSKVLNAIDRYTFFMLLDALEELIKDDSVRVIILTEPQKSPLWLIDGFEKCSTI